MWEKRKATKTQRHINVYCLCLHYGNNIRTGSQTSLNLFSTNWLVTLSTCNDKSHHLLPPELPVSSPGYRWKSTDSSYWGSRLSLVILPCRLRFWDSLFVEVLLASDAYPNLQNVLAILNSTTICRPRTQPKVCDQTHILNTMKGLCFFSPSWMPIMDGTPLAGLFPRLKS